MNERKKHINEAELAGLLKTGTVQQLQAERTRLIELKQAVQNQLANDRADERSELAEELSAGIPYQAACLRVFQDGDHDWRARARGLVRIIDAAISKINARLHELNGGSATRSAVVIAGGARSAATSAAALNALLQRGCFVTCFSALGDDLVVVATEPTKPSLETQTPTASH